MKCAKRVADGPENSPLASMERSDEGVMMAGGKVQTLVECVSTLHEPYILPPSHVQIARCEDWLNLWAVFDAWYGAEKES
jgi:hypothetical protein